MKITEPGIYDMDAAEYHADPCPEPSLSSGMARTIINKSALHCYHDSRRLNPDWAPSEPSDEQDIGTVLHSLFTGAGAAPEWVDAKDKRKDSTRAAFGDARNAGLVPMLLKHRPQIEAAVAALRRNLRNNSMNSAAFVGGTCERCLFWQEKGIWHRARLDFMPDDPGRPIYDLKFTGLTASPREWTKRARREGYDVQAALYSRGSEVLRGKLAKFRFIVHEWNPPYATSVIQLDTESETRAHKRLSAARRIFRWCLERGSWTGYPDLYYAETQQWMRNDDCGLVTDE